MKFSTVILFAVFVTACSDTSSTGTNPYKESPDALVIKNKCCVTLNNIRYVDFPEEGNVEMNISNSNDIIQLDSTYSYVEGIKLPVSSSDITLSVYSPIDHNGVFLPSMLVLDEKFKLLDFIGSNNNLYTPKNLFKPEGYYSVSKLPKIYPNGKHPSYIVFFSEVERLGLEAPKPKRVINDMAIRAGDIDENMLDVSNEKIQYRRTGRMFLEIGLKQFSTPYDRIREQKSISNMPLSIQWLDSNNHESEYYYEMIRLSVREGYFSKAATYMEEAENNGIKGARELFIFEVNKY
ncbi:hypothetical protein QXB73_000942 [Vibrio fluvialis]|nr:hypothetical protein [Vibrio fluvialis]MBY7813145.1 hypothetical protein [Vibrio fluvialis]MBY8217267.1 hypothetical protein [Vibrio fluvialis]